MGVPSGTTALLDLEERSLFLFPFLLLFSFTITALFSQTQLFLCSVFIFFQSIESLDLLSIAVIKGKKTHRQCGKERIYFSFVSIMEGSQDRSSGWELEAGAEAEIGKEQDSLIRCPRFAQPAVLYTQDHLSRGGTAHAGMDPPTSIMN